MGNVHIDGTLAKVKVQELQIARWTLIEEQQLTKFNMGNEEEPYVVKVNFLITPKEGIKVERTY